ncbi:MAG: phosphoglycerate mutase family protein [bacterium]|nr:phosphoglycerate mutase family protein [bacterium]
MSLPIDLVLIRHGQSEGNAAKRRSEKGDNSGYELLSGRHTRSFRLSEKGRKQAALAGKWLAEEFPKDENGMVFDRFITSEYARAMETAALLGLPEAIWYRNFYLTERDWGDLEQCPENERMEKYGKALRMYNTEPFFWKPPNGESFAELCLRLDRVLFTLHRECSDMRVIIVCHGEVMRAFRVLIERMSQQKFKQFYHSKKTEHRVNNCEILHYTRRDPETGHISSRADWMRRIRPSNEPFWTTGWKKIYRPKYSNEDLLETVDMFPAILA